MSLPRDAGREVSDDLFVGGALAGFRMLSFFGKAGLDSEGFKVEFDDDVDDSRTGGSPSFEELFFSVVRLVDGLLRVGLCCLKAGVDTGFVVAKIAGEYEEAELGVGTWLNGESV